MKQTSFLAKPSLGPTTEYNRRHFHCRLAVSSGTSGRSDLERLLHGRLRVASLITLGPLLLFFIRSLVKGDAADPMSFWELILHGTVVAIIFSLALYVWLRPGLTMCRLRRIELMLFGSLALFFAWMQYEHFPRCEVLCGLDDQGRSLLLRVGQLMSVLRWFFLIVVYGVFIPNSWQRCLAVVSIMVLTPLVLIPLAASMHTCAHLDLGTMLFETSVPLVTALLVAVFGSYRIHKLQEQALEAQQLGQYRLKQLIGAGGMGEVYLAEHVLLRRPCAVKLIRPEQAGDPTTLQRFEREVQAMATLTHWNTVEIFDYGHTEDGTFYYVMEYLPGQTLETLVGQNGPLPAARVIHFLRQICAALHEAHGIGLLHRDIKPSNIIACTRGAVPDVVKLLDFGLVRGSPLSKEPDRLTQLGTIVGSPPYMSPEQAAGKGGLDARSDIYSLGALAYYLLTGQPPFVRETAMLTLLAHAYEPALPPSQLQPGIPADLEAVVLRCLAKDPAGRFAAVQTLDQALSLCKHADGWSSEMAMDWWQTQQGGSSPGMETTDLPTRVTTVP